MVDDGLDDDLHDVRLTIKANVPTAWQWQDQMLQITQGGSPVDHRWEDNLLLCDVAANGSTIAFHVTSAAPLPGDATGNNTVNAVDSAILAANWGSMNATWAMGDFDSDGVVGPADTAILGAHWSPALQAETRASVPEPSMIILLSVLLGLGLSQHGGRTVTLV
ncbi:MAG: hypothetical protein JW888_08555 [Pirellulales bacterium]|nr:hypothetical protein [Pirellulales bacterium]